MKLGFKHKATGQLTVIEIFKKHIGKIAVTHRGMTQLTTLDHLRFSPAAMVEEHPDLKGKPFSEMKDITLIRFRKKLLKMNSEKEVVDYIVKDLAKYGYELYLKQKEGHRPERIK